MKLSKFGQDLKSGAQASGQSLAQEAPPGVQLSLKKPASGCSCGFPHRSSGPLHPFLSRNH